MTSHGKITLRNRLSVSQIRTSTAVGTIEMTITPPSQIGHRLLTNVRQRGAREPQFAREHPMAVLCLMGGGLLVVGAEN